jgi:hypothetical protein
MPSLREIADSELSNVRITWTGTKYSVSNSFNAAIGENTVFLNFICSRLNSK